MGFWCGPSSWHAGGCCLPISLRDWTLSLWPHLVFIKDHVSRPIGVMTSGSEFGEDAVVPLQGQSQVLRFLEQAWKRAALPSVLPQATHQMA
jgi:hypothetical protein